MIYYKVQGAFQKSLLSSVQEDLVSSFQGRMSNSIELGPILPHSISYPTIKFEE